MKPSKKITATLSFATSILLQSCSSSESTPVEQSEANTKAPELIASWATKCITTTSGTSTTTSASGGSTGGISGGNAFMTNATFNADGSATLSKNYFATANCNANTLIKSDNFNASYFIENAGTANDGSPVTNIRYSTANSTTYSIFQIINGISLYLGDFETSTPGNEGSSVTTRLDGLGPELGKN
jgi:hypothetical protein